MFRGKDTNPVAVVARCVYGSLSGEGVAIRGREGERSGTDKEGLREVEGTVVGGLRFAIDGWR